ncbi:MAG: hypothetical protein IPM97_12835 [Bdellovibrionaceae bacterium]|nr:hypothetical protein [Pseudobdellovibrionaceae bacterium]
MKLLLASGLALFLSSTSFAATLFCDGVDGYEISSSVPVRKWHNITVKKNGAVLLSDLSENVGFIKKDTVTGDYMKIYRGVTVRAGVINSIILAIRLNPDGGYTGTGDAVLFDGSATAEVKGLNCKMGN